jgi:hypothetical protein
MYSIFTLKSAGMNDPKGSEKSNNTEVYQPPTFRGIKPLFINEFAHFLNCI